jgi:hypothetical protein
MTFLSSFEMVVLHVVLARVKDDILSKRVNIQVAVLGAYGAIAIHGFLAVEGRKLALVSNGTAMAAGLVPDLLRGF